MFRQVIRCFKEHKILRGMMAYSMLWPTGCLVQQAIIEGRHVDHFDYKKCLRYCLYGTFVVGPSLYLWMRLASHMWPQNTVKSALAKAFTEQVAYDPFAICCFLWTMTVFETGGDLHRASREVSEKFLETYKVGFVYWPLIQTINFGFIAPKNQVIFASVFSFVWTTFLTYMKHLDIEHIKQKKKAAREKGSFFSFHH